MRTTGNPAKMQKKYYPAKMQKKRQKAAVAERGRRPQSRTLTVNQAAKTRASPYLSAQARALPASSNLEVVQDSVHIHQAIHGTCDSP